MSETVEFFNNRTGDRIFSFLHTVEQKSDLGVIFCAPFGEEKSRSYRTLTKFARYLEKSNIPSMRFDSKGCGDSDGELHDMTIESQVLDTCDAISRFVEQTQVKRVVLVGLRFGATIAALAAEKDSRVEKLVLLSPVIRGAHYWREILRLKQFSSIWLNQPAKKATEYMHELDQQGMLEIESQFLSQEFVKQLQAINLLGREPTFSWDLLITSIAKDSLACELADKLAQHYAVSTRSYQTWNHEEREYWSVLSLFDQYHPEPTFEYVSQWLAQAETIA